MAVADAATAATSRNGVWSWRASFTALTSLLFLLSISQRINPQFPPESSHVSHEASSAPPRHRRLSNVESTGPIGRALEKALATPGQPNGDYPFRVLYVITSLAEYDKGTRGTRMGADRLQNVVIPVIQDAVMSMVERGWSVDLCLVLGYDELLPERRKIVEDALPPGVGLEVWEGAMPMYYKKKVTQRQPDPNQVLEMASHGLSRQHRYVVKDKLLNYDFFACFEDDMRITASHVVNFLEMSSGIEKLRLEAERSSDGMVHVQGESHRDQAKRGKSMDKAVVGNDVVDDPITAEYLKRVIPGFIRVEVLDDRSKEHPLANNLGTPKFAGEVPIDDTVSRSIDPTVCCREEDPGRGKMIPNPQVEEVVIWETNVGAAGVRRYPDPIGWVGAMPVEDRADVGSYWSGEGGIFGPKMTRPRRLDATLGQQAGWMATRDQVEYFHREACPGGFLPPFDDKHWRGDSLQRHAVEFWSGGFQLFGQCFLNRVISLDPERFSRQLLYHTANNKQRTKARDFFVRAGDFLGQLYTVKTRAESSLHTGR